MPIVEAVRETVGSVWDPETRPTVVKSALVSLGAPKVLGAVGLVNGNADTFLEGTAKMTTIAGLVEKKDELVEVVSPYVAKARVAEGRKEIVDEIAASSLVVGTKAYVDSRVLTPLDAKWNASKEFAAPYVASVKEKAAPVTKKLEEIRRSERVEAMVAAFQDAREHPAEKVGELRSKAIDLIKYENLVAYRDHVMSEQFRQDTVQLVKVDLPAMAASAAKRGADGVKTGAQNLAAEIDLYKEKTKTMAANFVEMSKEKAAETKEELEVLRAKIKQSTMTLLSELQCELALGYTHLKTEGFSVGDTVSRVKRVVGVVDKNVVSPIIKKVKASPDEGATAAPTVNGSVTDEEEMKDAMEEPDATPVA